MPASEASKLTYVGQRQNVDLDVGESKFEALDLRCCTRLIDIRFCCIDCKTAICYTNLVRPKF